MNSGQLIDMTVPFSVQTPQWLNYVPLSVTYTKRVGGQYFGMGRNGSVCNASIHLPPIWTAKSTSIQTGDTIGQVPFQNGWAPV